MDKESTLLNVLLVEDSDTDAFLIQRALERHHKGVSCQRVATLQAGEKVLQEGRIDLVLLDLGLPDTASPKDTYEKAKKWTDKLPTAASLASRPPPKATHSSPSSASARPRG